MPYACHAKSWTLLAQVRPTAVQLKLPVMISKETAYIKATFDITMLGESNATEPLRTSAIYCQISYIDTSTALSSIFTGLFTFYRARQNRHMRPTQNDAYRNSSLSTLTQM